MNVVGKVGSFITQGVYSVATPFHPFGGAVDIIAVQQQDGSYRSTPWYVRFGKFQGVLRGAEKIVRVEVNGKECNFHMYIDNSGEAYFVREVVPEYSGELNCGLPNGGGVKGAEDGAINDHGESYESSGKVETLNRLESYDSSTGEFELQDEHVALGVDRLERMESDCDRRFYDFPDDELSEYGSGRYDNLDMGNEVESENLNSEVVLVSVDGHILTAPIPSSERNAEDVDLHTPQFHLGPSEGTEEFIDGESSWASDYLNNFETSTGRVKSSDVSPRNDGKAGTLLEDYQADENHPSEVEVHQDIEKQVTEEQLSSSNTSPEMNKENIFKSCLELPSLARQQGGSVSNQEMDSPEVHRVTEESQNKSPQSISVHENHDLQFTISANSDELSSSSSGIPGLSPLSDSQAQAESETTDRNAYDVRASGCDSMIYNTSYANGKLEREFDAATSPQGPTSEEIVANNDVECQTTPLSEENESETKRGLEISLCGSLLHSGMGSVGAEEVFDRHRISEEEFKSSAASIVKNENLVVRIQGKYLHWDKAAPIILGMIVYGLEVSIDSDDAISVEQEAKVKTGEGEPGISPSPSGRGWRLWPIPFRRVKTLEHTGSNGDEVFADSESGAESTPRGGTGSPHKHLMRTNVPTSDQIASLNLKEGQNMVTFISFSRVLGAQKVEAHIYLWRWNAKIVISDVDGTITKSDVLGQFMPLVGKDWTHTGIARLFSAIKENGYQLLFLSARAIVQAYLTKTFLFNLKQDGKTLPNGPVVISPDGLFPSLYREVIRRAPHEFKIACLEDIKSLFPPEYNPFYAGFGNRDTDELSYRKIGIPKGKIFIINPKGEVAINNRIDAKSYTSLHTLVHDMFPPTSLVEQSLTADVHDLQEDYNSWNYWKMPLPDVDG